MKLLTKAILKKLPTLDETALCKTNEMTVHLKLFNPSGSQTWYIYAYDPEKKLAMSFTNMGDSIMAEQGYVSIEDLEAIKCPPFGLGIARDTSFTSMNLQDLIDTVKSGGHV